MILGKGRFLHHFKLLDGLCFCFKAVFKFVGMCFLIVINDLYSTSSKEAPQRPFILTTETSIEQNGFTE